MWDITRMIDLFAMMKVEPATLEPLTLGKRLVAFP